MLVKRHAKGGKPDRSSAARYIVPTTVPDSRLPKGHSQVSAFSVVSDLRRLPPTGNVSEPNGSVCLGTGEDVQHDACALSALNVGTQRRATRGLSVLRCHVSRPKPSNRLSPPLP
jgi:hypothetical protein